MKKILAFTLFFTMIFSFTAMGADVVNYYKVDTNAEHNLTINGNAAENEGVTIIILKYGYDYGDLVYADSSNVNDLLEYVGVDKADANGSFTHSLTFLEPQDCTLIVRLASGGTFTSVVNSNTNSIYASDLEIVDGKNFYVNLAEIVDEDGIKINKVAPVLTQNNTLANSKIKLDGIVNGTVTDTFKIAYVGGSITTGSGVSNEANSFRGQLTKWFKDTYGENNIQEIKCSIGGTGSGNHVYRLNYVALSQNPDLVIVDTAVNDYAANQTSSQIQAMYDNMEGIIRMIYANNPKTDIILFDAITKVIYDSNNKIGLVSAPEEVHQTLADYYDIPIIDGGQYMYDLINAGQLQEYAFQYDSEGNVVETGGVTYDQDSPLIALSKDKVHPYTGGYNAYTDCLKSNITEMFNNSSAAQTVDYVLPAKYSKTALTKADIIQWDNTNYVSFDYASSVNSADGWVVNPEGYFGDPRNKFIDVNDSVITTKAGSQIKVKFKGNYFAVNMARNTSTGDISVSIDGGAAKTCYSYNVWSGGPQAYYYVVANNLSEGEHTAVVTVLGTFNGQRIGEVSSKTGNSITVADTKIAINGFAVNDRLITDGTTIHDKMMTDGKTSSIIYPRFKLTNISGDEIPYLILYAIYETDENGVDQLVAVNKYEGAISAGSYKQEFLPSSSLTVPQGSNFKYKCYFWKNDALVPLNDKIVIN